MKKKQSTKEEKEKERQRKTWKYERGGREEK